MKVIYSPLHNNYIPPYGFINDRKVSHGDKPERVEVIHEKLKESYEITAPNISDDIHIYKVHCKEYLNFLKNIDSVKYMVPYSYNCDNKYRFTLYSTEAVKAAFLSAYCALSGSNLLLKGYNCLGLCRPPGHHAGWNYSRGICYLNNAVIAAKYIYDQGFSVSILDFDLHHGNGTQELIKNTKIKYASIHEDPAEKLSKVRDSGFSSENSENILNLPIADKTTSIEYLNKFKEAVLFCSDTDYLIICAGFDISQNDINSRLNVDNNIFNELGEALSVNNKPKLILLEGGYYSPDDLANDVYCFIQSIEYNKN